MVTEQRAIRAGSAVLIVDGDSILLGRRNKHPNFGRWVLPGGKIEFGETHVDAAVREAKEELGLTIRIQRLAGCGIYYILPPPEHRLIIYSVAERIAGDIHPSSDISEARFFTPHELLDLDLTEIVSCVLRDESWLPPPSAEGS